MKKDGDIYFKLLSELQAPPTNDPRRRPLFEKLNAASEVITNECNTFNSQLTGMTAAVLSSDGAALASLVSDRLRTHHPFKSGVTVSENLQVEH